MSAQAWFSNDEVAIDPGATLTLTLSVHNLDDATDSYTIVPAGLAAGWTSVSRGNLTLFAGSQDVVEVEVSPPKVPTTTSGPTVVAVRVIPQSDPDEAVVAEATLLVQPFDDRRISVLQPIQRARRRAAYEFMVENHGNALASCRLRLVDPSNRIDGSFDPPAVGVPPGGSSLVRFKSKVRGGWFRRRTRTLDFEVDAEQQGHESAGGSMALVQPPTIPLRAIGWAALILALVGGAVAAWAWLIQPEIEDAAQQAVDDQIAEVVPEEDGDPAIIPVTTVEVEVDEPEPEPIPDEPAFVRLEVSPALNQTADSPYTIPDGQLFDLTDVRIENPSNDAGLATLQVNGETVFVWSLDNVRGSFFEPRITQIRLQPGDNVTFAVRCDAIGNSAEPTCTNAINIGGLTIEVDEV
ncbi:MAG: COG1470 family protein [Ilumatobacteraceae bacterium]